MPENNQSLFAQQFNPNLFQNNGPQQLTDEQRAPSYSEMVPRIFTETRVTVQEVLNDNRFSAMLERFQFIPSRQNTGQFTIICNRSQNIGLFLQQESQDYVRISVRSLVSATTDEFESRVCSSLMDGLQACYDFMKMYQGYDAFQNSNRF